MLSMAPATQEVLSFNSLFGILAVQTRMVPPPFIEGPLGFNSLFGILAVQTRRQSLLYCRWYSFNSLFGILAVQTLFGDVVGDGI